MRLALFILTMSFTTAAVAVAGPLDRINRETPVCLSKSYSAAELRARPLQTVREIAVQLFEQPDQKDHTVYLNLQVKREGATHDAFMICDRSPAGLACAVECDGGQAELVRLGKSEFKLQFVNKGFMIAGGCGGAEGDSETYLEPTPGGDDSFELETSACP